MRTLAVSNYKGGVGKTTTAVNLAAIYAARGLRVLLIDLDPQASATDYFGLYDRAAKDGHPASLRERRRCGRRLRDRHREPVRHPVHHRPDRPERTDAA